MFQIVFSEASPSGDTIKCHLSPEISADDVEIRWFKEKECVCFYKNGRFIEGIGYEGRVRLCNEELKSGNVSFQLKESDDGDYLFQVISGNRTEEKTVNKSLKDQSVMSHQTSTLWTEQPGKRWTDKERMEMANSALLAVFHRLEKMVAQTEKNRLQKDPQDIKATVLQTSREMEEEQKQTELKPTQQEDESGEMSENMEISASEPEEQKITHLDNQQSESLENREKTETEKDRHQQDPPGNVVPQTSREIEEKPNQIEVKATQQDDESGQISNCEEISQMEISASEPEEQKITHLKSQQSDPEQMSTQSSKNEDEPQQSVKKKQRKENNKPRTKEIKAFCISDGKTKCKKQFIDTLQNQIENLMEVSTEEESDIILNFCSIVSRAGTDIDAALNKFKYSTESKLNVLVVLHHTFDREKTVLDSSRSVNREDILTVDLLFYEDGGLLTCQKNSDAFDKVVNWLIQQGRGKGIPISPFQNPRQMSIQSNKNEDEPQQSVKKKQRMENNKPRTKDIKVFSISKGKTNESEKQFIDTLQTRIENLMEVSTEEESDIILNFCPIISQAGTDIDAALKNFKNSTESKLNVLVVLHHTFDPEKTVLDSSRRVNREDILTVDLLFYEDTGLLTCQKNSDVYDKVVNWLIQQGRRKGIPISQNKPFGFSHQSLFTPERMRLKIDKCLSLPPSLRKFL